ncbi:hypothetical protein AAHC03_019125 [Spirometra sp. Aus1]
MQTLSTDLGRCGNVAFYRLAIRLALVLAFVSTFLRIAGESTTKSSKGNGGHNYTPLIICCVSTVVLFAGAVVATMLLLYIKRKRASQASQASAKSAEQPTKDYGSVQSAKYATHTGVADKVTKPGSSTGPAHQAKTVPETSSTVGMYESPGLAKTNDTNVENPLFGHPHTNNVH